MLATQNPLEMEGTYPLPEAQLDRFFFKLLVKFPTAEEMEPILDRTTEAATPHAEPVFDGQRIVELSRLARQIPIADDLRRYGVALVLATHPENPLATEMTTRFVRYGSSPRGAQAIILAAKIRAILDHRYHVAREDLRATAPPGAAAPADPQLRRARPRTCRPTNHRRPPASRGDARGRGLAAFRVAEWLVASG